ncbi:NADP-dependent isocitrate dehydrogenase, partial [Mycobacterium sp. ITM-2017-0098]
MGAKSDNAKATLLGKTLDSAIGALLENDKGPSRKAGELLVLGLLGQFPRPVQREVELAAPIVELAEHFAPLAKTLAE